jgi:hypothetical protein
LILVPTKIVKRLLRQLADPFDGIHVLLYRHSVLVTLEPLFRSIPLNAIVYYVILPNQEKYFRIAIHAVNISWAMRTIRPPSALAAHVLTSK